MSVRMRCGGPHCLQVGRGRLRHAGSFGHPSGWRHTAAATEILAAVQLASVPPKACVQQAASDEDSHRAGKMSHENRERCDGRSTAQLMACPGRPRPTSSTCLDPYRARYDSGNRVTESAGLCARHELFQSSHGRTLDDAGRERHCPNSRLHREPPCVG
jgi:hypothetical protein